MTHRAFAERLEDAAAHISEVSRADLQVMLMNAALRLRNTSGLALEAEVDEAIDLLAAQLKLSRPQNGEPHSSDTFTDLSGSICASVALKAV